MSLVGRYFCESNYKNLPYHMQTGARLYVLEGHPPGDFLRSALENKFLEMAGHADDINLNRLKDWALWLYNNCPAQAKGSAAAVEQWCAHQGLAGLLEKEKTP